MSKDILSLVIMATIDNFDVSKILIDDGISRDIIYAKMFEKLGLKREKLMAIWGTCSTRFQWYCDPPLGVYQVDGYLGIRERNQTIDLQFLVVSYKGVYNCILGGTFSITLDTEASPFHIKLKYHNIHDDPVTIYTTLSEVKRIQKGPASWSKG